MVLVEYFCTDDVTLVFSVRAEWNEPKVVEIKMPVLDIRRETTRLFGNDFDGNRKIVQPAREKIEHLDEGEWQSKFGEFIAPIRE